jgi:hypothetical protein
MTQYGERPLDVPMRTGHGRDGMSLAHIVLRVRKQSTHDMPILLHTELRVN